MFHQSLGILVSLLALALAVPALPVGPVTCGTNSYTPTNVQAAINDGVGRLIAGTAIGKFPHQYRNFGGLTMRCAGPSYNEYPILPGGLYTGSSPGADRVVFDNAGNYCTVMAHTGAVRNGFLPCIGV